MMSLTPHIQPCTQCAVMGVMKSHSHNAIIRTSMCTEKALRAINNSSVSRLIILILLMALKAHKMNGQTAATPCTKKLHVFASRTDLSTRTLVAYPPRKNEEKRS